MVEELKDVPNLAMQRSIAILDAAAHPNAAKLFYNYLLSEEWQRKMGTDAEGLIPARPNTKMKYGAQFPIDDVVFFPTEENVRKKSVCMLRSFSRSGFPKNDGRFICSSFILAFEYFEGTRRPDSCDNWK